MMNRGSHFNAFEEQDGGLVQLAEQSFSEDYILYGNSFHLELDYAVCNGEANFTYVLAGEDTNFRLLEDTSPVGSVPVLLSLNLPDGGWTEYPVLIDLETGELTDLLADSGIDIPQNIKSIVFSRDRSKMLMRGEDATPYYCDLRNGTCYNVDELSGAHADVCIVGDDRLSCWALEGATDISGLEELEIIGTEALGKFRVWTVALDNFAMNEVFSGLAATPATNAELGFHTQAYGGEESTPGLVFIPRTDLSCGKSFAVRLDENKNAYVLNLFTGDETLIEGFTWPSGEYPRVQCYLSSSGNRLLIYDENYDNIYVLDYEAGHLLQLDTANGQDINAHAIYWSGNNQVVIYGEVSDKRAYIVFAL